MKKLYISALLLIAIGLVSCKDFLEPYSATDYTPKTAEHLKEMLLGTAYSEPGPSNKLNTLLEIVSDDVVALKYYSGAKPNLYTTNQFDAMGIIFSWQPRYSTLMLDANFSDYDMYTPHYNRIVGANAALDYADKVSGEPYEIASIKAEARTLRAYYYLQLVNIYGAPYNEGRDGLGVPLKLVSGLEDRAMTRNTVGEVYDQIVEDLLEAERLYSSIPVKYQFSKDYRPNLPLAQHILSRAYLYMEEWQKAAEYAEKVIANPNIRLLDLNSLPKLAWHKNTAGSPLSKTYYNFISWDNPECMWVFGSAYNLMRFTSYIMVRNVAVSAHNNHPAQLESSPELVTAYAGSNLAADYENCADMRLYQYIVQDRGTQSQMRSKFCAYGKVAVTPGNTINYPHGESSDFGQAMRVGEAYVIAAEAYAMMYTKGDGAAKTKAIQKLNELRINRFDNTLYTPLADGDFATADDLVQFTRDERRREMCFEGLRWFDLRRWGRPAITRTWETPTSSNEYTLTQGDPSYIFPIPHTVLLLNPEIGQPPLFGAERPAN